jgi:5-methyltetrahydrofolate--homocysteine methyltransferase
VRRFTRSVSVAQSLLSDQATKYIDELNTDYEKFASSTPTKARRPCGRWQSRVCHQDGLVDHPPPVPKFMCRLFKNFDLTELSTSTGRRSSRPGTWPGPSEF